MTPVKAGTDRAGRRTVPHTADLRIEAWAPTRDACIEQAVRGTVESFLDTCSAGRKCIRRRTLRAASDEDLLAAVLEEVIYLLDTEGEVPVDVDLRERGGSVELCFTMADARSLAQLGTIPKAVCLNEIRLSQDSTGWRALVTLDV